MGIETTDTPPSREPERVDAAAVGEPESSDRRLDDQTGDAQSRTDLSSVRDVEPMDAQTGDARGRSDLSSVHGIESLHTPMDDQTGDHQPSSPDGVAVIEDRKRQPTSTDRGARELGASNDATGDVEPARQRPREDMPGWKKRTAVGGAVVFGGIFPSGAPADAPRTTEPAAIVSPAGLIQREVGSVIPVDGPGPEPGHDPAKGPEKQDDGNPDEAERVREDIDAATGGDDKYHRPTGKSENRFARHEPRTHVPTDHRRQR